MTAPLLRIIAIVLDGSFGARLASLAERAAVWIVDSAENRPAIESLWTARRTRGATYDVTVFRMIPGLGESEHVEGVLRSVERPPDADMPSPPVGIIEVYGAEPTERMRATLTRYDYPTVEPIADGFRARRGTRNG